MAHIGQHAVENLLRELRGGNREAFLEMLPLVYQDLHGIAARQRVRWSGDDTLNTTALIHEAWLRLTDQSTLEWQSYPHFLAVAATAMRQILLDYAKRRNAAKRGGTYRRVPLSTIESSLEDENTRDDARDSGLIALDHSLRRLEKHNPRQSRIVECRFFGRMTIDDTATALGIATATVERDWAAAKAWLYNDMKDELERDNQ